VVCVSGDDDAGQARKGGEVVPMYRCG